MILKEREERKRLRLYPDGVEGPDTIEGPEGAALSSIPCLPIDSACDGPGSDLSQDQDGKFMSHHSKQLMDDLRNSKVAICIHRIDCPFCLSL